MLFDRTAAMHANLAKKGIQTENFGDDEKLIPIQGTYHRIVNRSVTDFCSIDQHPLVSIGAGDREWIVLSQQSKVLDTHYQTLKKIMIEELGNLEAKLDALKKFVRSILTISDNDVDKFCSNQQHMTFQDMPIINLDEFIKRSLGVCRHHGLFTAYLLNRLMKDKLIPKGEIMHCRDDIPRGAHVWVLYQPKEMVDDAYLIDTLWDERACIKRDCRWLKDRGYGDKAIENCNAKIKVRRSKGELKHALVESPAARPIFTPDGQDKAAVLLHYDKIAETEKRQAFIKELLDKEVERRVVILNYQNLDDLKHIQRSLEIRIQFHSHKHYQRLLSEVKQLIALKSLVSPVVQTFPDHKTPAPDPKPASPAVIEVVARERKRNPESKRDEDKSPFLNPLLANQSFQDRKLDQLHSTHFTEIVLENKKIEFIYGLLEKNSSQRLEIINKQNAKDLVLIRRFLNVDARFKTSFYYNNLLSEVAFKLLIKIIEDQEYWKTKSLFSEPDGIKLMNAVIKQNNNQDSKVLFKTLTDIGEKRLSKCGFFCLPCRRNSITKALYNLESGDLQHLANNENFVKVLVDWENFDRSRTRKLAGLLSRK